MSNINAESIKAKLQSLITASNTKTGKSDANLTDAVKTLLEGYGKGGGECDKPHVIEVEELPEVGETGVVYRIEKKDFNGIGMKQDDGRILSDALSALIWALSGELIDLYAYSKEPDTDNFVPSQMYYVESENALYFYDEDDGWIIAHEGEESSLGPFAGAITSIDQITAESPVGIYAIITSTYEYYEYVQETFKCVEFKGGKYTYLDSIMPIVSVPTRPTNLVAESSVIYYAQDEDAFLTFDGTDWTVSEFADMADDMVNDISEITEDGMYIVCSGNFIRYAHPTETKLIRESGIYDVTDVKMATIDIDSISGAWKLTEAGIGIYDKFPVNFTTIYEGKVVQCIGMQAELDLTDPDGLTYILEDGSVITAYDGYTWASDEIVYVDFGKEPQVISAALAKFIKQGTPIYDQLVEVETEEAMNILLEVAEIGAVYRYIGPTTENYQNGALYVVHLPMVSFTIDGADYQGEEDMTWTEWCASEYDTIGCVNASAEELIYNSDNTKQLMLNDTAVYGKDVLAAGAAYVFITIPVEEPSTEEPNEHGTTVTVNQYSEEDNDYGTTVVIGEEDEAVNLISFSVDSKTYQAEDGMTWGEWVDSEYNTDGYSVSSSTHIKDISDMYVMDATSSSVIQANTNYSTSYSGGSGN